ncbi:hypothetical protein MTR_0558s0030, partial [Medicago truncatula]
KAYRVFNKRTLTVVESIHVAFDETPPEEVGKGTFCFDVTGIDTKEIVKDGVQQEAPSKNEAARTRNLREIYKRRKNKKPHHRLRMIGSPREIIPWKTFLVILETM